MKAFLLFLFAGTLLLLALAPAETIAQDQDIRDFVTQIYYQGVPYDEANDYGPEVVPTLLEMLGDTTMTPYWANIAVTLSIIGDERAVEPLIAFIETGADGTLDEAVYRAKSSTVMALGYLINKTGNEQALDYLVNSLNPEVWGSSRDVQFRSEFQASTDERDANLSTMAMLGLALSGRPEAAEALRSVSVPRFGQGFQAQVTSIRDAALEALQEIQDEGLEGYYEDQRGGVEQDQ